MLKNTSLKTTRKKYQLISLIAYIASIVIACILLLVEPSGFDAKVIVAPLIAVLFLSSIGIGYKIAMKNKHDAISIVGAAMVAILFTFVGFFIVAAVAWFIGLAHAA